MKDLNIECGTECGTGDECGTEYGTVWHLIFLSTLCWPLLKVHFAGHAHVKLVLDVGMWVTDWECSHWLRIIHARRCRALLEGSGKLNFFGGSKCVTKWQFLLTF